MSILDTFLILFDSNADQVKKGSEEATAAGKSLEDQLGSTGDAGVAQAEGITSANVAVIDSFQDINDAADEAADAIGAMPDAADAAAASVGTASASQAQAIGQTTRSSIEAGEAAEAAGKKGVDAAEKIEASNNKLSESFEELIEHVKEFGESFVEQALEVTAALKGIFAVESLVDNFFENAEHNDQLGETAKSLGVSVEQLDAWGNAVKRVGGTAEGFQESLRSLEFRLQRVALAAGGRGGGRGGAGRFFQQLGIDPAHAKEPFALLEQLSTKIEGMDKTRSGALLHGIGLDEGTIRLLQAGGKEVQELIEKQKLLGVTTKEDTEVAEAFNREWMDVKELFSNMVTEADTGILPFLTRILEHVEHFIEFFQRHSDVIVGFFTVIGVAVVALAAQFGLLDFLASPWILLGIAITTVITAIGLVYDDLKAFANGHASLVGEMAKKWPVVGEAARAIIAAFTELNGVIEELYTAMVNVFSADFWLKAAQGWLKAIDDLKKAFPELSEAFDGVGKAFQAIGNAIIAMFKGILDIVNAVAGAAKTVWGIVDGHPRTDVPVLRHLPGDPRAAQERPFTPGGMVNPHFAPNQFHGPASAFPSAMPPDAMPPGAMPPDVRGDLGTGKEHLATVQGAAPLIAGGADAGDHSTHSTNTVTVNIGPVTSGAPDAAALAAQIGDHVKGVVKDTLNSQYANGYQF